MYVKLLEFIHIKGMSISSFFIDEYSRFGYVYLIHRKSNALNKFIKFKAKPDSLLGKHIHVL